jgi:hypothetical protein
VLIVHGDDGLDELTTTGPSTVWELDGADTRTWRIEPSELGLTPARPEQLVGGDPATNARIARAVLAGEFGAHRDVVVLNAAAGLLVAGAVADLAEGVEVAGEVLDSGGAAAVLERLVTTSRASGAPGPRPAAGGGGVAPPATAGGAIPTDGGVLADNAVRVDRVAPVADGPPGTGAMQAAEPISATNRPGPSVSPTGPGS